LKGFFLAACVFVAHSKGRMRILLFNSVPVKERAPLLILYLRRGSLAFFFPTHAPKTHTYARGERVMWFAKNIIKGYIIFNRLCCSSGAFSLLIISYRCRFFFFLFHLPAAAAAATPNSICIRLSCAHLIPKPISN
jgi:hypothetical protein